MKTAKMIVLIGVVVSAGAAAFAVEPLSPCGLVADGGNGKVYLDWNPSTFDAVVGYHVYRVDGSARASRITKEPVKKPEYVVTGLDNSKTYSYVVTGVLAGGGETPMSPGATATPAEMPNPKRKGNRFIFADGQEIELDGKTQKLISWKSPDGLELASPKSYGSPIYLSEFDERGLHRAEHCTEELPQMGKPISKTYDSAGARIEINDGRVIVRYSIPMAGYGATYGKGSSYIMANVWETWYPVERKIGPTIYRGIARRIELDVPTIYQDGFALNLNDGFGVDGSCKDAVTYRSYTWGARVEIRRWTPDEDQMAFWNVRWSSPREFHPDQKALNVHPFLFVDHPKGTMILTARRQHYAIHAGFTNYVATGKDGLWPNFAVDLDNPGRRFCVDTFEYLFSPDRTLATPQRYLDARFHYFRRMAELYGYPTEHPNLVPEIRRIHLPDITRPNIGTAQVAAYGDSFGKKLAARGIDNLITSQEFWLTSPYVTPELMHEFDHPINQALAAFNASLKKHGVAAGFWFRPETVTTTRGVLFSDRFCKSTYFGYQLFPKVSARLEEVGIPLVRNNKQWLRKCRGDRYIDELADRPEKPITAYSWTPMSMHSGWYDEVIYPTFKMAQRLGYTNSFFDGGFGAITGVDYAGGRATAVQPYWTRLIRTACHFGVPPVGECGIGAGALFCFSPSSEKRHGKRAWMFAGCPLMCGGRRDTTEQWMHKLHQLYAAPFQAENSTPRAHAFAKNFVKQHGAPRRVVLDGLRPDNADGENDNWVWDRVFWEFADGRRVEYPPLPPAEDNGEAEE